jgi:hypothetical protein
MIQRLRLASAIAWTLVILVLCWTPDIYLPVKEEPAYLRLIIPIRLDKIVHAGIFLVFAVLWLRGLGGQTRWFPWVLAGGVALAAISELGQNLPIVHRDGEFEDAVADVVGLVLGFPVFFLLESVLGRLAVGHSRREHEIESSPGEPRP